MNKVVIGLLVAVCLLGFALILLNERMGVEVAAPAVIAEAPQSLVAQDGQSSGIQQHSSGLVNESNIPVFSSASRSMADIVEQPLKIMSEPTAHPETANKGLDEVLSERASEVQAPNQQASIIQQSGVADLVAEPPQLPQIGPAIPMVSEPKPQEATAPQPVIAANDNAKEQVVKAEEVNKKQDVQITEPVKKESPKITNSKSTATPKSQKFDVTLFTVFTRENGATVRLRTNAPLPYSSAQLQNPKALVKELQTPDRLMFDLTGIWNIKEPAVPNNVIVNRVRVGKMADRVRIVVDLKSKPKKIRVKIAEKKAGIDIFLDR